VNGSVVYWVISTLAVSAGIYLAYLGFLGNNRYGASFSLLMINISLLVVQSAFMILSYNETELDFWFKIRHSLFVFLPLTWLNFTYNYSRKEQHLSIWFRLAIYAISGFFIYAIWSNPLHSLYFSDLVGSWRDGYLSSFTWNRTALNIAYLFFAYGLVGLGIYFLASLSWQAKKAFRGQKIIIISAGLVYAAISVLSLYDIIPRFPDWSSVLLILICFAAYLALIKFRLQKVVPLAHDLVFQDLPDGVLILDRYFNLLDINQTAEEWFAITKKKKLGRALDGVLLNFIGEFLSKEGADQVNWKSGLAGAPQWLSVKSMPLTQGSQSDEGWVVSFRDVSSHQRLFEEVQEMAHKDPLTELNNRRYFFEKSEHIWEVAYRHLRPISLVMMDLDHFKDVNDNGGHGAGDLVLKETARIVKNCLRTSDVLARFGGEEFVALLPETHPAEAIKVAEKIRFALSDLNVNFLDVNYAVSMSLGVASFPSEEVESLDALISLADKALYRAKKEGRNRVVLYSKDHAWIP
jgi:diguanylate cyclase (GGDEF)-like protein